MKVTLSTIYSLLILIGVFAFSKTSLFYIATVFLSSIIKDQVETWALSNRIGTMHNLSLLIKFFAQLIVLYAKIGYIIVTIILIKLFI